MAVLTLREALNQAMSEEMERDPSVFVMGEEVAEYNGAYKVTKGMLAKFGPMRVVDSPISEAGFCGLGVGAAMAGLRPVIEMMTWNFAIQAFDQIINHAAKMFFMSAGMYSVPMVIRGPHGAAHMLGAQHSQCVDHMLVNVPGMYVVSTIDPADAKGLMKAAIRSNNPVCFLESEMMYGREGEVPDGEHIVPIGVGAIKREGTDVTIIAWNKMTLLAHEVAEALAEDGISVEILDPRTLQPLDEDLIFASVRKTHRLVIIEEGWGVSTIGTHIVDRVVKECFDELDAPPERVTNHFVPMHYNERLEHETLPNKERALAAVNRVLYRS
ncbi:MAG: alpha-ketoacid dehydrogenase subunit beta [Silvanigrellales bacterium]|jgi:pyruvate dehydrogenase E1 component beta subunit|nr:alpha-ketoacid dehydrogenase subunit beta [Silvanigrellales bacterium]